MTVNPMGIESGVDPFVGAGLREVRMSLISREGIGLCVGDIDMRRTEGHAVDS